MLTDTEKEALEAAFCHARWQATENTMGKQREKWERQATTLRGLIERAGWQPIETAPKDGTWFSAWDGKTVFPARWAEDEYDNDGPYAGWCFGDEAWGGTLYSGVNRVRVPLISWQPLPTPPTDVKGDV